MDSTMEKECTEQAEHKKGRHRKKELYKKIKQQMEFYFSDSNLARDRFVNQMMLANPEGYVALDEFLKFNKIKCLTDKASDIRKAVCNSAMLSISEDGEKVKRSTEIGKKEDADDCMIYVEALPKTATHDYVREVFSRYGPVAYVSLPRYKHSRKIKEFGFVEFENKGAVEKVLNAFKEFGGVLQYQDQDIGGLQSIVAYNLEQKGKEEESEKETEPEDDAEPPAKKVKIDDDENTDNTNNAEGEEVEEENEDENKAGDEPAKKRSKKKKKPTKPVDEKIFEMKIMSKREWTRLRSKYLNLQRIKFKEIKQKLQEGRKKVEPKPKPKQPVVKIKTSSPRKINFYGALPDRRSGSEDNVEEEEAAPPAVKKPLFSFEPGLIVNLKFQAPCVDVPDFKTELRQFSYVKYVDLKEGDMEAFVRVDKVGCANQLVKFYSTGEIQAQVLSGEVEQHYWAKMMQDREKKLSKAVKLKGPRGREKLNKKIASHTHIRFEDN